MNTGEDHHRGPRHEDHHRGPHHPFDWDWHGLGGPFGSVRRHPFTVVMAGLSAAATALLTYRATREHRRAAKALRH